MLCKTTGLHRVGHSSPQKTTKAPKVLTFMCSWIITQGRAMTKISRFKRLQDLLPVLPPWMLTLKAFMKLRKLKSSFAMLAKVM